MLKEEELPTKSETKVDILSVDKKKKCHYKISLGNFFIKVLF